MDAWPDFWELNKPLFDQHIAAGNRFVNQGLMAYFIDGSGKYVNFPDGYVTGPVKCVTDWQASVRLGDSGWLPIKGDARDEAVTKGREYAIEFKQKKAGD